jgi:serine/threonine protein kinase
MLGSHDLEHELGAGARSAVYRGRDKSTGALVAVKLVALRHGVADTAGPFDLGATRLDHPNIAAFCESAHGRLAYVVTEFAHGADLGARVRAGELLPLPAVLHAIRRVAAALHYAHRRGVVHGDVKPANIVVDPATATVKLIDFPSCADDAAAPPGTPVYLSPERLRGMSASPASDQFALGVTLYQLACGHLPFCGRSWPEIVHRVAHEPHTDIRAHAPLLPPGLAAIVDTALAKNPAQRYRSVRALGRAISALQAEVPGAPRSGAA